ncbi:hypothetical protein ACFV1N_47440 [Streptosporangium canum]|uniref:hypothetical protein n=1 Tax=Streptosporangium canum TaxID=324952 RepID=UPI00369B0302
MNPDPTFTSLSEMFAPGWPERAAYYLAVALVVTLAALVAFTLAEEGSLRGRVRAVRNAWRRAAEETITVETHPDGTVVARTTTRQTALHLLRTLIGDEEL